MTRKIYIPVLAVGHGINDLLAGYFLGTLVRSGNDITEAGIALLIYNLLAFGGQYPVALLIEKLSNRKWVLLGSCLANVLAVFIFTVNPFLAVVLAGIASAFYHVAGGSICARESKALHIGLFAAPGVAGLILGGYWAWQGNVLIPNLFIASILFSVLLTCIKIPVQEIKKQEPRTTSIVPDKHDLVMILLLTVIVLRSAVWNIFQIIHEQNYEWLIAIASAAFTGKIIGGWLADKIGWRIYIFISLFAALPLVTIFKEELLLFCIGIGLLQSGIPATTALLIHSINGKTERAVGHSFGTAIIIGAFAFSIPAAWMSSPLIPIVCICGMVFLLWKTKSLVKI